MIATRDYGWESYSLWQDHCPHSVTVGWQHRKTVAAEKIQEKIEANRAAVVMDVPIKTAQALIRKAYPDVALDEVLLEEALDVLRPYAKIRAALRQHAEKNHITIYTIVNRMRTIFPGKTFCDLTEEDQARVCAPPKPYIKKEAIMTRYAREYGLSVVSISNRMRYRHPGMRFNQLTVEQRIALCTVEIKKKSRVRMDRVKTKEEKQ